MFRLHIAGSWNYPLKKVRRNDVILESSKTNDVGIRPRQNQVLLSINYQTGSKSRVIPKLPILVSSRAKLAVNFCIHLLIVDSHPVA